MTDRSRIRLQLSMDELINWWLRENNSIEKLLKENKGQLGKDPVAANSLGNEVKTYWVLWTHKEWANSGCFLWTRD